MYYTYDEAFFVATHELPIIAINLSLGSLLAAWRASPKRSRLDFLHTRRLKVNPWSLKPEHLKFPAMQNWGEPMAQDEAAQGDQQEAECFCVFDKVAFKGVAFRRS